MLVLDGKTNEVLRAGIFLHDIGAGSAIHIFQGLLWQRAFFSQTGIEQHLLSSRAQYAHHLGKKVQNQSWKFHRPIANSRAILLDLMSVCAIFQVDSCYSLFHNLLAWSKTSVCTKFQVDSSNTFGVNLWKANLTSVTFKIKVTSLKSIGIMGAYGEATYQVSNW